MAKENQATKTASEVKQRPIHEIRLGRIKAAIWENDTKNGTFFNVTIARLFKDGDAWKRSESFGRDDLPLVAKIADLAHSWIFEKNHEEADSNVPY